VWCTSSDINSTLTLAFGAADMVAALQLSAAALTAATSDTSALKVNLVSGGLPAASVSVGLQLQGETGEGETWCLLTHTGPRQKPGASSYTLMCLSLKSLFLSLAPPYTCGSVSDLSMNAPVSVT